MAGVDQSLELPRTHSARHREVRALAVPGGRGWWPYLIVSLVTILLRWPTLSNRLLQEDEASFLVQALRLRSLDTFIYAYAYRTETRTQIALVPYIAAEILNPENAMLLVRIMGLAAALASCWLMIAFSRRFLGTPLPGLAASVIWALFLTIGPGYELGWDFVIYFPPVRPEYFQTPFLLASIYALGRGVGVAARQRRPHAGMLFAAGSSWAIAVLIKPPPVLLAPLFLVAIPWLSAGRREEAVAPREVLAAIAAFLLGAAWPLVGVFGPYFLNSPALAELRFNLVDVSVGYGAGHPPGQNALNLVLGIPPLLLLVLLVSGVAVARQARGQPASPPRRLLAICLLAAVLLFAGNLPGWGLLHYLIPIVALLALVTAGCVYLLVRDMPARLRQRAPRYLGALVLVYVLAQLPLLVRYPGAVAAGPRREDRTSSLDVDALVTYIAGHSHPGAAAWVYYGDPEIFLRAHLYPATRDPQGAWMSYIWNDTWFQRTLDDLVAERPDVIVGIDEPLYPRPWALPLQQIPRVGSWIARNYHCDPGAARGATVCLRSNMAGRALSIANDR